jgi:hypothetical protein
VSENEEKLFSEKVRLELVELLYRCHSRYTFSNCDDEVHVPKRTFKPRKEYEKANYTELKAKYRNLFSEDKTAKQN